MSSNRKVGIEIFASSEDAKKAFAETKQEIRSTGEEAQKSSKAATIATEGLNSSNKTAAAAYGTAGQAAKNYAREIRDSRAELAQMGARLHEVTQQFGRKSTAAADLRNQMAGLATNIRQMAAEQAILIAESRAEKAAIEASASAFDKKTTRISVGRGVLSGYDAAIESLVRASGGLNLSTAIGIGLFSNLLPLLLNLGKAERERIEISKEMIATDQARSDAQTRTVRTNADLIASMVVISKEQKDYQRNTRELKDALSALDTAGQRTVQVFSDTGGSYERVISNSKDLRGEVTSLNTKITEQEKTLLPAIETITAYRDATGKSTDEVIRQVEQTGRFAAETLPFLREQLNATIPFVNELTDALAKLRVPQFSLGATPQGVAELEQAVLSGLQATFEKGIGGSATKVNDFDAQVRALRPVLSALDEALKRQSSSVADYHARIAALNDVVETTLKRHFELEAQYKKTFEVQKKSTSDLLALEKDAEAAKIKAMEDVLLARELMIKAQIRSRRAELERDGLLTAQALKFLAVIEQSQMAEVEAERRKLLERGQADRLKLISEGHEARLRLEKEFYEKERRLIIQQGRETRVRLEAEENAFRERRTGRETRRGLQADEIGRQARELDRVQRAFGRASRNAETYRQQVALLNGELSASQAITLGFRVTLEQFTEDWIRSGEIFRQVGDSISSALQGVIANGESFGAAMKAMLLGLIADMATYWGRYFISLGAGMLWTNPAAGAGLIAAGVALLALAGVLRGFAQKIQQGASATAGGGGSAASGGSASGSFTGERSKLSPGSEFTGDARIAEIDRRIARLQSFIDRLPGENSVFERAFRRQLELLQTERRALLEAVTTVAREASRPRRFDVSGSGPGVPPVFNIDLRIEGKEAGKMVVGTLEKNGVVTLKGLNRRQRGMAKRKLR